MSRTTELVVISGKGGTGKTSVAASIVHVSYHVLAVDCDVDASNLPILLSPAAAEGHPFAGIPAAFIDDGACSRCGHCRQICRFNAVRYNERTWTNEIDQLSCEGCGACVSQCASQAIQLQERIIGEWFHAAITNGELIHARLYPGSGNSGRLVAHLREEAHRTAAENQFDIIVTDASPGIGCPVISSLTGASYALIVTEPTVSAEHDLVRLLDLLSYLRIAAFVCVNKYDIDEKWCAAIERACIQHGVHPVGRIPYDHEVPRAMANGMILSSIDTPAGAAMRHMWADLSVRIGVAAIAGAHA